jgi:hypothetical protein
MHSHYFRSLNGTLCIHHRSVPPGKRICSSDKCTWSKLIVFKCSIIETLIPPYLSITRSCIDQASQTGDFSGSYPCQVLSEAGHAADAVAGTGEPRLENLLGDLRRSRSGVRKVCHRRDVETFGRTCCTEWLTVGCEKARGRFLKVCIARGTKASQGMSIIPERVWRRIRAR